VVDYRDPSWQAQVVALAGGRGVDAAVNAARGQAALGIEVVGTSGRFATITGDPPASRHGIRVSNFCVRADGAQLGRVAALLRDRTPMCIGAI
jgi:NADPH:quinone reductase-like Zn-dependent oxidoreductase